MSPEIWFFFTPDGTSEITVLNRDSARQVARLLTSAQKQVWRVRKNRWPEAVIVADCTDIYSDEELAEVAEAANQHGRHLQGETTRVQGAPSTTNNPVDQESHHSFGQSVGAEDETVIQDAWKATAQADPAQINSGRNQPAATIVRAEPVKTVQRERVQSNSRVTAAPVANAASMNQARATPQPNASGDYAEKRKHPRFDLRLRVVVISGNRSFRSFSRNISKGGLLLEHVIPLELLDRPCRVIIGSMDLKENIEFDARLAGDPKNPRAIEFFEGQDFFVRKLDSWMESIKKSAGGVRAVS